MGVMQCEVYFDDSGTDRNSPIAVAACYISTKSGWDDFVKEFDRIRREEDFPYFHMAEFVAKPEYGHEPFCKWDKAKKDRVYSRIVEALNPNKSIGIAIAVPKSIYDQSSEPFRAFYGKEHYTFAVRMCLKRVAKWRVDSRRFFMPMQYFFDWEDEDSEKRTEIDNLWKSMHPVVRKELGANEGDGYSFQSKQHFEPLQAADILAWQMKTHMENILPYGEDRQELTKEGFMKLRLDQEMDLLFFTESQMESAIKAYEQATREGLNVVD